MAPRWSEGRTILLGVVVGVIMRLFLIVLLDIWLSHLIHYIFANEHHHTPGRLALNAEETVGNFSQHNWGLFDLVTAGCDQILLQIHVLREGKQDDPPLVRQRSQF